jgi:chromosome segregation ATPase
MAARLRFAFLFLLVIGLVTSLGLVVRQSRQLAEAQRQKDRDQQSLRVLQNALHQQGLQQPPLATEESAPESDARAALKRRDATISRLTQALRETQGNLSGVQGQLSAAIDDRQKALAGAEERFQNQQTDWRSKLDALQKQLDGAQAESEVTRQRLSALEAENDKLRSARREDSTHAAQLGSIVASLQDLDRRRDVYLTSIMRRYRDITNQFRATSGMLDSSRDSNSNALSSASLTRIQNAVSQADEDLRQLNELNDQTHQLEKKLANK